MISRQKQAPFASLLFD